MISSFANMQTVELEEPKPNVMNTSKIPQFKKTLRKHGERQIILKSNTTSRAIMSPRMNLLDIFKFFNADFYFVFEYAQPFCLESSLRANM